jgi:hypothetical protein
LSAADLIDDAFRSIAREAADNVDVTERLLDGLVSLGALGDGEVDRAARRMLREARSRALAVVAFEADRKLITAAAARSPEEE